MIANHLPIRLTLALLVAMSFHIADAGPYCGRNTSFAPAPDSMLPVAPVIAQVVEEGYDEGRRRWLAKVHAIKATIDGTPVSFTTTDVHNVGGVTRLIKIKSRKLGKLEIWGKDPWNHTAVIASYTITDAWSTPDAPAVSISRRVDTRLAPYHRTGDFMALRVDVPAIAFTLRWRRDHDDTWRVLALAAVVDGASEAWLGQVMCGALETVPLTFLERGIEAELTAKLPDGRDVPVALPNPLAIPPHDHG